MRRAIFLFIVVACGGPQMSSDGGADAPGAPIVEIRADTNRNGTIDWNDPTESANKDTWDSKHGAIFLANIDDDESACPKLDENGVLLNDIELPKCNDAADTAINGEADLLDLAPLETKPWPEAPTDATGRIAIDHADRVHLFKQGENGYAYFDPDADVLAAAELRAGVHFLIEATDIVRNRSDWDGMIHVSYKVGDKTDRVALRVSPVMTRHHMDEARRVYVTRFTGDPASAAFINTLKTGMTTAKGSLPQGFFEEISSSQQYGGRTVYEDQWTQDFFELGYMSMPIAGGKQHVIDVYLRSANIYSASKTNPLRSAGKIVFLKFRGPDAAGVQQFDTSSDPDADSLNSTGNYETIPPYDKYPLGRLVVGHIDSFHPDASFFGMLEAQGVQPPVKIDTSWLFIGHVDETLSFLKAPTSRGWTVLVNDARLAKQMLEDASKNGHGSAVMFEGLFWDGAVSAQVTIDQVLADMNVMAASAAAAAAVDSQLQIIEQETGIGKTELVHVPFLHFDEMGFSLAYQPGTVNGLYFAKDGFAMPEPHGPIVNGKDIFKDQMETELSKLGIKPVWIEDWDLYHALFGEVHCGTNALRTVPDDEKWWTY